MLSKHISEIQEGIKNGLYSNEAAVSQGIVLRLLSVLGWPTYDTQVVIPEFNIENKRVDYALCYPKNKPVVFIEVKPLGGSEGADRQLFEYAFHRGVPMAIVTDGEEWHFYLPTEQGLYDERKVYKLDLIERDVEESTERLKRYLEYEAICSGKAIEIARRDYQNVAKERQIEKNIPIAWKKLIEEHDELLIEILSEKVQSLCGYQPTPDMVINFLDTLPSYYESPISNITPNSIVEKQKIADSTIGITQFIPRRDRIKVTFPDGTVRDYPNRKGTPTQIFVDIIERIGILKVKQLGLYRSKTPLISDKEVSGYTQHRVSNGDFLFTNLSTSDKVKVLEEIRLKLNTHFKIEGMSSQSY